MYRGMATGVLAVGCRKRVIALFLLLLVCSNVVVADDHSEGASQQDKVRERIQQHREFAKQVADSKAQTKSENDMKTPPNAVDDVMDASIGPELSAPESGKTRKAEEEEEKEEEMGQRDFLTPDDFDNDALRKLFSQVFEIIGESEGDKDQQQKEEGAENSVEEDVDEIANLLEESVVAMKEGNLDDAKAQLQQIYKEKSAKPHIHANATYYLGVSTLIDPNVSGKSKYTAAEALFLESSEYGNVAAQRVLGFMYASGLGVPRDQSLSLLNYYFAAIGGDPSASMVLGYRHMYGIGVPKSCEAAVRYYMEASEKVISSIQEGTHVRYLERIRLSDEKSRLRPVDEDEDVIHYYEHAADAGDVNAQVVLGHLNHQGVRGVERNIERASSYFHQAAGQGDPSAMAQLGQMYAEGVGIAQNNVTAYRYFKKAADLGNAAGYNGLGFLHLHGQGVEKDLGLAVKYFKQAADRGSPDAQFSLGTLYYTGHGVDKSYVTALHYFTAAGHQGHTTALYNLAQMHLLGHGTIKSCSFGVRLHKVVAEQGSWALTINEAHKAYLDGDYAKALLLYGQTAEMGFEVSQANVGWMLEQPIGYYEDDHHEIALHYWRLAADQGNADAQRVLGDYYYYGRVGPVDFKEAVRRYQQAADRRNAHALFNMGYMYHSGAGVELDLHLAKRYYDLAIQASSEAYVPCTLALTLIRLQNFWTQLSGISFSSGSDVGEVKADLHDSLEGSDTSVFEDTLLLVMCGALTLIVYMRRHRLNE